MTCFLVGWDLAYYFVLYVLNILVVRDANRFYRKSESVPRRSNVYWRYIYCNISNTTQQHRAVAPSFRLTCTRLVPHQILIAVHLSHTTEKHISLTGKVTKYDKHAIGVAIILPLQITRICIFHLPISPRPAPSSSILIRSRVAFGERVSVAKES